MANSQRNDPDGSLAGPEASPLEHTDASGALPRPDIPSIHGASPAGPAAGKPCPDCACPELTMIRDSEIVTLYKCPRCGHLAAPVKRA